jgi:polyisoprenoid-binding protein YceI
MLKKVIIPIGIIVIVVLVAGAAYVLRPTAEASAPIEAMPVVVEETSNENDTSPAEMDEGPAVQEVESNEGDSESNEMAEEMPAESEPKAESSDATSDGDAASNTDLIIAVIDPAESEVRFTLGELLGGVPTTVIGVTDQVAGEIAIDPENPADSKVGVILVNARTFVTDNNFRNRAINNEILETDEFELITFTPTAITGFPENPAVGDVLEFQITGDLTIRDITQEITFDTSVTVVSETRLEGYASAMIARADYDLRIPNVPRVADVDEEVLVEIEFVALRK